MLTVKDEPRSLYAEQFRTIKTNIKYSSADKDKKVFLVTSSNMGDGKSTVSSNLAISLSMDNKKVIVIDCDLRRPTIHKKFMLSIGNGLTEVLIREGTIDKLVHRYSDYLDVLTAGTLPPNPAELLSCDEMVWLLRILKETYDYIILDAPPLGIVADSQIMASMVDGIILVVRSENTKKENLIEAKKILDQVEGKLIGVIMNRVKSDKKSYYYY